MLERKCPSCKATISYKTKQAFQNAVKKNTSCKKCTATKNLKDMHLKMRSGEIPYGFQGKSHSIETSTSISNSVKLAHKEGRLDVSGKNNGMFGKSYESNKKGKSYDEIYGKEKSNEIKRKLSKLSTGKNNPMYGKPSPQGSGNGWSGWYNDWYFRSLRELSYVVNVIERFNLKWKSAESIKIPYINENGEAKNYFPDFLINDKYLIEIKPKKLFKSAQVIQKKTAAEEYCKRNKLIYKLISPRILTDLELIELVNQKKIKFLPRYHKKFLEYTKKNKV